MLMRRYSFWRKTFWLPFILIVLLLGFVFSGALWPWHPHSSLAASSAPLVSLQGLSSGQDLDRFLETSERQVVGLKPELAKGIVWVNPSTRAKTSLSIVYLHGFSASRMETSPVMETAARRLGANLFYTRLAAHGLNAGEEFQAVRAQNWIDDAREALAIGRKIGDRVVLTGMSTGATLALQLANENLEARDIAALILMSPNHRPRDWRSTFIAGPLGQLLARLALGAYTGFHPSNEAHRAFWTSHYRSEGIAALMDVVNHVRTLDLAKLQIPTLTLYSHHDTVVDVDLIRSRHEELGSPLKRIIDLPQATRHELAGEALAPEAVPAVVDEVTLFIEQVVD